MSTSAPKSNPHPIPPADTRSASVPPVLHYTDSTETATSSDAPQSIVGVSIWRQFLMANETMSTEHRGYMWAVRPLLWLNTLTLCLFCLSNTLELLYIIWWQSGTATMQPSMWGWGIQMVIILIVGALLGILSLPQKDYLFSWRIIGSLTLIAGSSALGILKGWLPPLDVIINGWFIDRTFFSWLPLGTICCGIAWIVSSLFAILVKYCCWSNLISDPES